MQLFKCNYTKDKLMAVVVVFFIISNTPFAFDVSFGLVLRSIIMIATLSLLLFFNHKSNGRAIVGVIFLANCYILIWFIHSDFILKNSIILWAAVLFFILLKQFVNKEKIFFRDLYLVFIGILTVCSICSFLLYNFINSEIFNEVLLANYRVFYNPLLGYISIKDFLVVPKFGRPQFFFQEPNYAGVIQGFNFLFILFFYEHKFRNNFLILIGVSVLLIGSLGGIISLALSIFVYVIQNANIFFKSRYIIILSLIILLFVYNIDYEWGDLLSEIELVQSASSSEDREYRINKSSTIFMNSNIVDIFWGRGAGYIETITDKGESNGLLKMLIEEGCFFTITYLFVLYRMLDKHKILFLYCLIFLNVSIMHLSPLFMFMVIIAHNAIILSEKKKVQVSY